MLMAASLIIFFLNDDNYEKVDEDLLTQTAYEISNWDVVEFFLCSSNDAFIFTT